MKKLILTFLLSSLLCLSTIAQPTISSSVSANSLVCIGSSVKYQVDFPTGLTGCYYSWKIKSGIPSLEGVKYKQTFNVTWSDQKPNTVEVEVVVTYSSTGSCTETITLSFAHTLRTVFQEDFLFAPASPPAIDYCSNGTVFLSVTKMYIPNTGTGSIIQTEVDQYQWILPTGWKEVDGSPGTVYTTANSISIGPINKCVGGGDVIVRGVANITSCIAQQVSVSLPATITLKRSLDFKISPPSYTALCGIKTPVLFSVPTLPCATSYAWTSLPTGWSGTSTTNSITLTPNGSNGGLITVVAALPGCNVSASYTINFSDPDPLPLSYSQFSSIICTNTTTTYILKTSPATNYQWYSVNVYQPAGAPANVLINGQSTSAATPLNTTATSVSVTSPVSPNGYGLTLNVRGINGNCKVTPLASNDLWVGVPDPGNLAKVYMTSQYGVNPIGLTASTGYNFAMDYVRGATIYNWYPPTGFSLFYYSQSPLSAMRTSDTDGTYSLICQPENSCGLSTGSRFLRINISGGGGGGIIQQRIAFPNPANATMTVTVKQEDSKEEAQVTIFNKNFESVFHLKTHEKEISIPVSNIPDGNYFLHIQTSNGLIQKQIVIKH